MAEHTPGCVQRNGRECRDCVECLAALPAGQTCNDCAHAYRCKSIFGAEGTEPFCQFLPSRFLARGEVARG